MPFLNGAHWRERQETAPGTGLAVRADAGQWRQEEISAGATAGPASLRAAFLATCANPACDSGWLHLWRGRTTPIFDNGWTCSASCTRARVQAAVRRELDGKGVISPRHRHRIPLGLVMLEQGWITSEQLRQALAAQRTADGARLGQWLIRQQGVSEQLVTRALGLQWSCPVLTIESHDVETLTGMMPRLFVDAFGALPLRLAAGKLLYLGFDDRIDMVLAHAIERMSGLRVECGLVKGSLFRPALARMLKAKFPAVQLVEAVSEAALVQALAKSIELVRPVESRLVRVHDLLWLRMWTRTTFRGQPEATHIHDLVGSIQAS